MLQRFVEFIICGWSWNAKHFVLRKGNNSNKKYQKHIILESNREYSNKQSPIQSCRSLQALHLCKRLKSSPKSSNQKISFLHSLSREMICDRF